MEQTKVSYFTSQPLGNWIIYTLMFSGFLHANVAILTAWFRIPSTLKMLNGWNTIENQFEKTFGQNLHLPNLANGTKRLYLFSFKIPMFLFALMGFTQLITSKLIYSNESFIVPFRALGFMVMITITTGIQCLYYLLCYIMSQIYLQIYEKISESLGHGEINRKFYHSLSKGKVLTNWKSMLIVTANQIKHIGDFISLDHCFHVIVRVIIISVSLYTILKSFSESYESTTVQKQLTEGFPITIEEITGMAWVALGTNLAMTMLDVYFAEKIYNAVNLSS